jgi:hypothetical protein
MGEYDLSLNPPDATPERPPWTRSMGEYDLSLNPPDATPERPPWTCPRVNMICR